MDKQKQFALIFSTGPTWTQRMQNVSRAGVWRLIRHNPGAMYSLLGSWLVGRIFKTPIRHVAVTNGTVVIDHNFKNIRFWAHEAFIVVYPNVISYVPVNTQIDVDWKKYEREASTSLFYATFARFAMLFTGGLYQCDNCVKTVRAVMKDAGIDIPRSAWHPRKLLSWLTENGYGCLPGPPPSYCE